MTPIQKIYWLRVALGIVAALLATGFGLATGTVTSQGPFALNALMNGLSIALLVYLITYYLVKSKFQGKVEKPQKLMTTGIGIFFFSWLVFWILLYSILAGPPPA
jgi:hypothetical protein